MVKLSAHETVIGACELGREAGFEACRHGLGGGLRVISEHPSWLRGRDRGGLRLVLFLVDQQQHRTRGGCGRGGLLRWGLLRLGLCASFLALLDGFLV